MVPSTGMPNWRSASTQAVPTAPAMYAARAPSTAPSYPWARREPNSITGRPLAARTMRLVFVQMRLWWLKVTSSSVSISCASMAGPSTVTMGSLGKMGVPSSTAQTLQWKEKWRR